jgi:hypothetical protein
MGIIIIPTATTRISPEETFILAMLFRRFRIGRSTAGFAPPCVQDELAD